MFICFSASQQTECFQLLLRLAKGGGRDGNTTLALNTSVFEGFCQHYCCRVQRPESMFCMHEGVTGWSVIFLRARCVKLEGV